MRAAARRRIALLMPVAAGLTGSAAAPPRPPVRAPMVLGIATHFDQGWPVARLDQVRALGAAAIRDDFPWSKGEPAPGRYVFDGPDAQFVRAACARGIDVLLMVTPANPAYDGGKTAHSPGAQAAYARFVAALLDHAGPRCVRAVEIGNEINADGLDLPPGVDPAAAYAGLLAASWAAVKPRYPGVAILGGSTNAIGTGLLASVFAKGGLAHMDGVVVHPYRDHPEGVEVELAGLNAAMRRAGGVKPVWATEFGREFADPRAAAGFMLRMACLLGAAGVERAYWYDLVDEPAYRNMGLYDPALRLKAAGRAARLIGRQLGQARPVRVDAGDATTFVFRFAPDRYVLWGAPRGVAFAPGARFLNAEGEAIPAPDRLSAEPIVALGAVRYRLLPNPVLADSLYQYSRAPWSYYARRANGEMVRLGIVDWTWTSYFGAPDLRPLEIRSDAAVAAGDGGNPLAAALRYTAPADQQALVSACFAKKRDGAGLTVAVLRQDKPLYRGLLEERGAIRSLPVRLRKGDALDFAFAPKGDAGGNGLQYRIRLLAPGTAPIAEGCP